MNETSDLLKALAITESELIARAHATLRRNSNVALATVSPAHQPWNTPVFIAYDEHYRFYWSSHDDAVHSKHIELNRNVMIAVFDSSRPDETGAAVYIRAVARELTLLRDVEHGLECLAKRKDEPPKPAAEFLESSPRRVYEAVPESVWTNVVHERDGHFFDERVRIVLRDR